DAVRGAAGGKVHVPIVVEVAHRQGAAAVAGVGTVQLPVAAGHVAQQVHAADQVAAAGCTYQKIITPVFVEVGKGQRMAETCVEVVQVGGVLTHPPERR